MLASGSCVFNAFQFLDSTTTATRHKAFNTNLRVLRYADDLNGMLSPLMFMELITASLIICMLGFQLILVSFKIELLNARIVTQSSRLYLLTKCSPLEHETPIL